VLVLGVGNPLRRDDGAGAEVARLLGTRVPPGVEVRASEGGAASLLDAWAGRQRVVLVDAVSSGAPAGRIERFDAAAGPLPAAYSDLSSHGLGVAQAIELARALRRLPNDLVVYGITGADFEHGQGLTPAVAAAVEQVAERVLGELGGGS
jgi:hydrogenase maturation protease